MFQIAVLTPFLFASFLFAENQALYQELWALDQAKGGLGASVAGSKNPKEIVINEQARYLGKGADAASLPLFTKVDSLKLQRRTYQTLVKLLDNYEFAKDEKEDALGANPLEDAERVDFIDAVVKTEVGQRVFKHFQTQGALTEAEFSQLLTQLWFEPFNNYYGGNEVRDCTGFEHVFVGEEGSRSGFGGYHYWYTFFLQEKTQTVDFLGHNYGNTRGGETIPSVATLAMRWNTPAGPATKEVSGFLVGPSPELILLWGALAYAENAGTNADKEIPVSIEGADLNLVLYRNVERGRSEDQVRGKHIRSFYPKYMGLSAGSAPPKVLPTVPQTPKKSGTIRITQALINAPGAEERGNEWVEIQNLGENPVDLTGWTLQTQSKVTKKLTGTLQVKESQRVVIEPLSNRGGTLFLFDAGGREVAHESYWMTEDGKITVFSETLP
jgi:poly(U)-specific endoribonuclease